MTEPHEVVIRFGRPFDIRTPDGVFLASVQQITVPFTHRESAEAAQREVTVSVRQVHDAGGEDYRPVILGEVVTDWATVFYLLACLECGDPERPLPMPFGSAAERGKWASEHTAATGHDRWRVWEERRSGTLSQ